MFLSAYEKRQNTAAFHNVAVIATPNSRLRFGVRRRCAALDFWEPN